MLFGKYGKVVAGLYIMLVNIYDDLTKTRSPKRIYDIHYMAQDGKIDKFLESKRPPRAIIEAQKTIEIFYGE